VLEHFMRAAKRRAFLVYGCFYLSAEKQAHPECRNI